MSEPKIETEITQRESNLLDAIRTYRIKKKKNNSAYSVQQYDADVNKLLEVIDEKTFLNGGAPTNSLASTLNTIETLCTEINTNLKKCQ